MSIMVFVVGEQVLFGDYAEMLACGFSGAGIDESDLPPLWGQYSWGVKDGILTEDLGKLKSIAHDKRREKRERLLSPIDSMVIYEIGNPSSIEKLESDRVKIRQENSQIQLKIDNCDNANDVHLVIGSYIEDL